jgi:hypothetical protein
VKISHAGLLAAILGLSVAATPIAVQNARLGAYNEGVDGTAHLFDHTGNLDAQLAWNQTPVHLQHGPTPELDPFRDALLILGPERGYDDAETQNLRAFLEAGGRALVADDTGSGRTLVDRLNVNASIEGTPYYSPAYAKSPAFPLAASTGAIGGLPDSIVTSQASVVTGSAPAVYETPEVSWLDENANHQPDLGEEPGPFGVARLADVGQGELFVLGDPTLFAGSMTAQNDGLVEGLLAWLVEDRARLVVDEGHRAQADPVGISHQLAASDPGNAPWLAGGVGVVLVAAWASRPRISRIDDGAGSPRQAREEPRGVSSIERQVLSELEGPKR